MINRHQAFRSATGQGNEPLALAGSAPAADLEALALLLTRPAIQGEFLPASLIKDVSLEKPHDVPRPAPGGVQRAFSAAVAGLISNSTRVGVKLSGGLDSLAVLLEVLRWRDANSIHCYTVDLTDDEGRSSVEAVQSILAQLHIPVHLHIVQNEPGPVPWSAAAPRLDALPEANARANRLASEHDVGVLLSGDAADELFGVPRFASAAIARRYGLRAAMRYARDSEGLRGAVPIAAICSLAGFAPPNARARLYWAVNWPGLCDPEPAAVLAEPYRDKARAWSRTFIAESINTHAVSHRSWTEADQYDAVFPYTALLPAGSVPEASPFMQPEVLATALALPPEARYDPTLPWAYWRCKGFVIRLISPEVRHALPRTKQYYSRELARVGRRFDTTGLLAARIGLVDARAAAEETETATVLSLAAVERWLHGAVEHGIILD